MYQDAFEEIKIGYLRPPVIHLQIIEVGFNYFLDASKTAAISALYQIQNNMP